MTSASTRCGVDARSWAASSKSRPPSCLQYPRAGTDRTSFMKHSICGHCTSGGNTPSTPMAPPGCGELGGAVQRALGAGGFDDDVVEARRLRGAEPLAQLDLVRIAGLQRHLRGAHGPGRGHRHQPDGPSADDGHPLAGTGAGEAARCASATAVGSDQARARRGRVPRGGRPATAPVRGTTRSSRRRPSRPARSCPSSRRGCSDPRGTDRTHRSRRWLRWRRCGRPR